MLSSNSNNMTMAGLPFGAGSVAAKKKDEMASNSDSLFSMAMFRSQQQTAPSAPLNQFYAVDEFKGASLRELLDLSEDCLFSDDDMPTSPVQPPAPLMFAPVCTSSMPAAPTPPLSQEDLEWQQLEDPPLVSLLNGADDLPVAAALVGSMDQEVKPQENPRKRSLADSFLGDFGQQDVEDLDGMDRRFRPYQTGQWTEKFDELVVYRKNMGHCLVPHTYNENLPLARWVKRQRYQYKLMKEGKSSTMTEERVQALEDIGFVWDSQGAAWSERLEELRQYRMRHGHANVPSNYSENPQLATWVKCQRRQYKLYQEQKPSNMTADRITQLNFINFEWELRSYKKARTC